MAAEIRSRVTRAEPGGRPRTSGSSCLRPAASGLASSSLSVLSNNHNMPMRLLTALLLLYLCLVDEGAAECLREPVEETKVPKASGTNGFHLEIRSHPRNDSLPPPQGYIPGEFYTILIRGWKTQYSVQTFRGFSLVAVADDSEERALGQWQLDDHGAARRSHFCHHGLAQTSLHPKSEVAVIWRAPNANVGCIHFKAMVLEYRDLWYMDEDDLNKKFCQIIGYERMLPNDEAKECCACDEARYELIFEGYWSRQTHPKDFPSALSLTHFSDLIGASHSRAFTMWDFDTYATDGLKELAEWGNTYSMEQELKSNSKEIRTIIKARGLWYPNVQGITKAMFRTDKYHHLMSLISMMGPSPDWCVGVSSVNLCTPQCKWVGERSFPLFLWDAGTDSGATYMAPNNPTLPREKIKNITTSFPADPRSPFYDPYKKQMPPLAKLIIRREKVYPMDCKNISEYQATGTRELGTSEDLEFKDRTECTVGDWTPWSLCSATCGKGIRMRSRTYKFPIKAQMFQCERQMTEKQFCQAPITICENSEAFNDECSVSSWTQWSDCSVTCEKGIRTRTRNYNNPAAVDPASCSINLVAKEDCIGGGGGDCSVTPDPRCRLTFWSQWSPCSASCGDGTRVRTRLYYYTENKHECDDQNLMEKEDCNNQPCSHFYVRHAKQICAEEMVEGQCGGQFPRYYYDQATKTCKRFIYTGCKGNRNNFETEEQCLEACSDDYSAEDKEIVPANHLASALGVSHGIVDGGESVDCMVTEWAPWSDCSKTCGRGRRKRTRAIKVLPRNGGRSCPTTLIQRRRCQQRPCPSSCRLSAWSAWSACSVSCGQGFQLRERGVYRPRGRFRSSAHCSEPIKNRRRCFLPKC